MDDVSEQLIQDRIRDLRENTDFVATLFESLVGYAIVAADFDGNVIAYNNGAHQIYGYAPEEIIGRQSVEVFFPHDFVEAGALQRLIEDLIGKGRLSLEGEKVRKSGEAFPAQMLFTLTKDKSGRVVGFVEIVEDLSERKQAEEALRESEVMRRMSVSRALVGQMLRDLQAMGGLSGGAMFCAGQELATRADADTLPGFLGAFSDMGLGTLTLNEADEERRRWTFSGDGLVEREVESSQPTCNYTRGFLCGAVARVVGGTRVAGVEVACQSMEDEACRFVVQVVGE
jgi:PAS domain S-box-containing protein